MSGTSPIIPPSDSAKQERREYAAGPNDRGKNCGKYAARARIFQCALFHLQRLDKKYCALLVSLMRHRKMFMRLLTIYVIIRLPMAKLLLCESQLIHLLTIGNGNEVHG